MAAELCVIGRGPVLGALAPTKTGFGGMFTVFTDIVPIVRDVTHVPTGFVTAMLVLSGIGATIGNAPGGSLADRPVDRTPGVMLAVVAVTLVAFAALMRWPWREAAAILLRDRAALADMGDGGGGRRAEPRGGRGQRRIRPRQCHRRGAGRRRD